MKRMKNPERINFNWRQTRMKTLRELSRVNLVFDLMCLFCLPLSVSLFLSPPLILCFLSLPKTTILSPPSFPSLGFRHITHYFSFMRGVACMGDSNGGEDDGWLTAPLLLGHTLWWRRSTPHTPGELGGVVAAALPPLFFHFMVQQQ